MTERIHRYLDGELPLEDLDSAERARAAELEAAAALASRHLRAVPAPDLAARVMAAIPAHAPAAAPRVTPQPAHSPLAGLLGWLWQPRAISLRPAYAFAALLLAAVALFAIPRGHDAAPEAPVAVQRPAGAPPVYVQFRLEARGASSVKLAGTFTGWKPAYSLVERSPGEWTVLVPLTPGVHDYAFVIDGQRWVADPNAAQVDDSFGGTNSRISLPPIGAS